MEMRAGVAISAPTQDAWVVVGDLFGEIGGWASAITASFMDGRPAAGQVRTCEIAGFGPVAAGVIKERLVSFDPAARSLAYEAVEGLPRLIVRAVNRWLVDPGPDGTCTVRIHATVTLRRAARPLGPVMRWRMRADTRRVLAELRHRVETGEPLAETLAAAGPRGERAGGSGIGSGDARRRGPEPPGPVSNIFRWHHGLRG